MPRHKPVQFCTVDYSETDFIGKLVYCSQGMALKKRKTWHRVAWLVLRKAKDLLQLVGHIWLALALENHPGWTVNAIFVRRDAFLI